MKNTDITIYNYAKIRHTGKIMNTTFALNISSYAIMHPNRNIIIKTSAFVVMLYITKS